MLTKIIPFVEVPVETLDSNSLELQTKMRGILNSNDFYWVKHSKISELLESQKHRTEQFIIALFKDIINLKDKNINFSTRISYVCALLGNHKDMKTQNVYDWIRNSIYDNHDQPTQSSNLRQLEDAFSKY